MLAGITWDRHTLHERGREETAVVASRTMVEDGSGHTPSLRLRTETGRDLPGPVALDLQVGARLTVTTDPDGGSWSLGGRPDRPSGRRPAPRRCSCSCSSPSARSACAAPAPEPRYSLMM